MNLGKTALALAALGIIGLTACNQGDRATQTPAPIEYQSPDDVKFLFDEQGNVPQSIPVEVLQDIRAQFLAQGETALLKEFEARYDMETGLVKNAEEALHAERFLKANLKQIETEEEESFTETKSLESLPEGMEIPPAVAEHQKLIQQQGGK